MEFTIFGILWLLITAFIYISNDKNKIAFITLLSGVFQCDSVLIYKNIGVGPLIINSIIFIIYYLILNFRLKEKKPKEKSSTFPLVLFVIVIFISNILNDNELLSFKFLQLLIYIICFVCLEKYGKIYKIDSKKIFMPIINFVALMGIIQLLVTLSVIPDNYIINNLIYNERSNLNIMFYYAEDVRLFSTFMEPSYCGAFLVGALMYVLSDYKNIKHSKLIITILFIEILLTLSTTAYVGAFICCILYLIMSKDKKILYLLIPLFIISLIVLIFNGKIYTVIINKATSGSAHVRDFWNKKALEMFKSKPLFGGGYSSSRASSIAFTILGELGIAGMLVYFINTYRLLIPLFNNKYKISKSSLYVLLACVICQLIAIPDMNFCVFWIAMYLVALTNSSSGLKKENGDEHNE